MRCFIAIDMPADVIQECKRIQGVFDMGLKKTKSFHLTLKFLGEIDEKTLGIIKEKLKEIKTPGGSLELSRIGVFPDEKRPRVLWIGLEGDLQIQKEVDEKLSGIFDRERFHAHITLARISFLPDKSGFLEKLRERVGSLKFDVDRFVLYKSTLTREGPIYEKIEEYYLSSNATS